MADLYHLCACILIILCIYIQLAPSAAPHNVTAVSVRPSSLLVSWLPPLLIDHNGDLTGFRVSYGKVGSRRLQSVQLSANVTMYTISQLIPSTEYRVRVACINSNGTGPFSVSVKMSSGNDSKFYIYSYIYSTYVCKCSHVRISCYVF